MLLMCTKMCKSIARKTMWEPWHGGTCLLLLQLPFRFAAANKTATKLTITNTHHESSPSPPSSSSSTPPPPSTALKY
uniref:Putative secreted protein n=1 Tax=Anopheles darlingi TaxID=43151 RepID=A0A2M4DEX2_ANODA